MQMPDLSQATLDELRALQVAVSQEATRRTATDDLKDAVRDQLKNAKAMGYSKDAVIAGLTGILNEVYPT